MVSDNIGLIKKEEIVNVERLIGKITPFKSPDLKGLPALEIQIASLLAPVRVVPGIIPEEYVGKEVFVDLATSSIEHNPYLGAKILRVYEKISDKKESPGRVIAQNTTMNYKVNL